LLTRRCEGKWDILPVTVPICTRSINSPNWSAVRGFVSNVCFRIDNWPMSSWINLEKKELIISWRVFYQKTWDKKYTSSEQLQHLLSVPYYFLLDKVVQSNSQLL
jgi:endogenous inhibitor of DNA gyrase (YacG/DUF329 family)